MNTKICTSIKQSKKLIELKVDVNTADMCYYYDHNWSNEHIEIPKIWDNNYEQFIPESDEDDIPAWSLIALLELMPDKISINNESYYLSFTKKGVEFRGPITWDGQKTKSFKMDNILDSAFEMVCWLKKEEYI